MDGVLAPRDPLLDAVLTAVAPVLRRMREEVDARLAAIEAAIGERVDSAAGQLHELVQESRRRAEDAIRDSAEAVRSLAAHVSAETRAIPDRLTAQVSLLPRPRDGRDAFLPIAAAYVTGRVYEPGEVCTHRAGCWQAINRTAEEPGPEAAGWRVLADGLAGLELIRDEDPRSFWLGFDQSDGLRRDLFLRLPLTLHRGLYASDALYELNDEVAMNGSTWRCLVEKATTSPPSDEWSLVAVRGERGARGAVGPQGERGVQGVPGRDGEQGPQGEQGERGISVTGVIREAPGIIRLQYEDDTVSPPIDLTTIRYRGVYTPGETYQPGDLVRFGYHLFVAQNTTNNVPQANSEDWSLFLPGVEPGGSGPREIILPIHFRGVWQVAQNIPDLLTLDPAPENGDLYHCATADPLVPEQADPAIPGIGGLMIGHNDWIIWSEAATEWSHVHNPAREEPPPDSLVHGRAFDGVLGSWQRSVAAAGDTMTGPLVVQHDPAAHVDIIGDQFSLLNLGRNNEPRWILGASHFVQAGFPHGLYFARMSADGSAIVDFPFAIERGNGNLHLGDTELFGARTQTLIPRTDDELICKGYLDDRIGDIDRFVEKAGDVMTGFLTLHAEPVDDLHAATKFYVDDLFAQGPDLPTLDARYVNIDGDTMRGDLSIRHPGATTLTVLNEDLNQPTTLRLGQDFAGLPLGYNLQFRAGGGQTETFGFTIHRDTTGTGTQIFFRIPLQEDHVDMRRPRTLTGDATDPNDLVRLAQVNASISAIDRFVLKAGDELTGPLRWNAPATGEAVQITHGIIRIFGGAIDVQAGIDATDNFGSEVRANWFVVPTDGRGLAFGTLGQDGGLYKAAGSGLRLRQSSGNQRIAIEPNDGGEQWDIIDQRGGGMEGGFAFHREGTASVGGQQLTWHDDAGNQARLFGSRYAAGDDLGSFLLQLARPDGTWATAFRARQTTAEAIPRIELAADPLLPMDAATRQYVDRLASGAPHFIGTVDAATGQCSYTPNSGHPDGPLVDPADAASGAFLICTNGGNDPTLPGPMEQGDWLVTDGNTWTVLQIGGGIGAIGAANVLLQPPVLGQPNVQLALQETETRVTANEAAINDRVSRTGDTMTGFLTLSGAPTLPLHAATRGYLDDRLAALTLPVWTQGANYSVNQTVLYDNRGFRVLTAINNAPATPDFTTITPTGYGQSDYWHGDVNIANWEAGNWAYIADLPAYGAYRLAISDLHSGQDTSIVFDIVTGFNLATATLIGHTHQGTGSWSTLRLNQNGNAGLVRVELQIGIRNATPNLKIIISGEARGIITNQVRINKPPTASVTGIAGGNVRATIPNLRVLSLATSGSLAAQGAAPFIRLNSDTNTSGRATLEFGTATQDQFGIYRNSGAGGLYFDAVDDAGTTRNAMHITRADGHLEMDTGLRFGSVAQSSPTDLTRHIALWGGATPTANAYGFSITSGTLNLVAGTTGTTNAIDFHPNGQLTLRLNNTRLALQGARSFQTTGDNHGLEMFGGAWIYKRSGGGLTLRTHLAGVNHADIEDSAGNNRRQLVDTTNGDARYQPRAGDVSVTETGRYRWSANNTTAHTNVPFFTGSNANGSLFEWRMGNNNNSTQGWISLWIGDSGNVLREAFLVNTGNPPRVDFRTRPTVNGTPVMDETEGDIRYIRRSEVSTIVTGAWQTPASFSAGWSGPTFRFRWRFGPTDSIEFRGTLVCASTIEGAVAGAVFTLPVGYRPAATRYSLAVITNSNASATGMTRVGYATGNFTFTVSIPLTGNVTGQTIVYAEGIIWSLANV